MPTSLMKKVANKCDMSLSDVEDKWQKAKKEAEDQGHKDDWGYVTSIFKNMVGEKCAKKMGWTNESFIDKKIKKYLN